MSVTLAQARLPRLGRIPGLPLRPVGGRAGGPVGRGYAAAMEITEHVVLFLHFVGWAALLGGMVVQLRMPEKAVNAAMRDGIGLAFLAGLALVGIEEAGDDPVNHAKVAVKFTVGLVVLVLVMANMRKERIPDGLFYGLLLLTLGNMAVAIFW